jgi:hypothetical protein
MKLDLVLCLATAAYAAPTPRVQNAVAGVKDAVSQLFQRLGNTGGRRNVAQGLKEKVTGGPQVSAQLLELKAANRVRRLPVLTDREKEGLKYFKLSRGIKKVEDEIALLRKVKSGAYERSEGQSAHQTVVRYTKLYGESFPKAKDVAIDDLIEFAQKRAHVLKNRLTKVKKLSYAGRLEVTLYDLNHGTRDLQEAKSNVAALEARLKAIDKNTDKKSWDTISTALKTAKRGVEHYEFSISYWKKFLNEKSVKAAKNILNSVEIAQNAVTNSEKQLATWRKEFDELNGMASPADRTPAWFKWMQMYGRQKDIPLHIEISLDEVKNFAQGKIRIVEERLKREKEILQNAQNLARSRSSQETEKLQRMVKSVSVQGGVKEAVV